MVYDEAFAARVRKAFGPRRGLVERPMFGGIKFMLRGHMVVGVVRDDLVVRLGPGAPAALHEPHARPMDFTGKVLSGMVYVNAEGTASDAELERWVGRALAHVKTLPARPPPGKAAKKTRKKAVKKTKTKAVAKAKVKPKAVPSAPAKAAATRGANRSAKARRKRVA